MAEHHDHEHHHHDHEHEHEHCHDLHHEHGHHDHEHHHEEGAPEGIELATHEAAVIGTVRCRIPGSYETALASLRERMEAEAADVEAAGGMIGHLKAYAREENRSCMLSITESGDLRCREGKDPGVYAEHAAIVFGLEEELLGQILSARFGDLF